MWTLMKSSSSVWNVEYDSLQNPYSAFQTLEELFISVYFHDLGSILLFEILQGTCAVRLHGDLQQHKKGQQSSSYKHSPGLSSQFCCVTLCSEISVKLSIDR